MTDRQIGAGSTPQTRRPFARRGSCLKASSRFPARRRVNLPSARTIDSGGMNDFEADLLGQSALHFLPWTGMVIKDALRDRLEAHSSCSRRRTTCASLHIGRPAPTIPILGRDS